MYGFDVSTLVQATIKGSIYWSNFFNIIWEATCGFMYTVNLYVRYGTDSAPAPSVTDHIVVTREGQLLHCNAMLDGIFWISHPVTCKIIDSTGKIVFKKTKWLVAGIGQETDFFRNVSLSVGYYDVEWSVCDGKGTHRLTVSALPPDYVTNDIDIEIVVTDTEGINAKEAWNTIKEDVISEMLVHNATVELISAEVKGKYLVIFHLRVTAPPEVGIGNVGVLPIGTIVVLILIATVVYFLVAVPAIEKRRVAQLAYNTTMQEFTYEDCAAMVYNEWVACMAANYPDVWEKIKDKIEAPKPPEGEPDWMDYITYGLIAIFALAGLYVGLKYVVPALRGAIKGG